MRALAGSDGRELRFGIRLHVVTRDTSERGLGRADELLAVADDDIERPRQTCPQQSVGQRRMVELHGGTATPWRSTPTCGRASGWSAAEPEPRWSAATTRSPTGSPSTATLGIDEFILSGYPHLEEAYRFGEGVLPILRERGLAKPKEQAERVPAGVLEPSVIVPSPDDQARCRRP